MNPYLVLSVGRGAFPVSYDGSGVMFALALFSLMLIASLSLMLGGLLANHLIRDRHHGYDGLAALRLLVLAVCVAAFIRCSPEVAYNIAYAEAAQSTLKTLLFAKRVCDTVALIPVLLWMGTFWAWYPTIALRLRSPTALVWSDHRFATMRRFVWIVVLTGLLASVITLGRVLT